MANNTFEFTRPVGLRHAGAAIALILGIGAWSAVPAQGQQPAPKKAAPAAQPAQKGAAPAAKGNLWVKLCDKVPTVTRTKEGKEEKKEFSVCRTQHERLDVNSGRPLITAAIQQVEGQDKQGFVVMVPPGVFLPQGMQATVYSKDLWAHVQKNEKVDEAQLKQAKSVKLIYTLCHEIGCIAESEASPEFLNDLKTAGGLMIGVVLGSGQPVGMPVPLDGFNESYAGKPADLAQYKDQRRALMQQIAQRQQQMAEEYRKKQQEQQQAGQAPAAPAAPAAKAAPPAKK
jgi:invasion protein IalB